MNKVIIDEHFKRINYLFYIILFVQVSFFVVSLIIVENYNVLNKSELDDAFKIIIPVFGIIVMFLSNTLYKRRTVDIQVNDGIEKKLKKYQTSKIIQWALIEAGEIFSSVGFIVTRDYFYAVIFLFLIGYYFLLKPSRVQLKTDMKI